VTLREPKRAHRLGGEARPAAHVEDAPVVARRHGGDEALGAHPVAGEDLVVVGGAAVEAAPHQPAVGHLPPRKRPATAAGGG
jgi:hypothetical protein